MLVAGAHLTVYHVNPLHDGVIPLNMDTADLRGDMSLPSVVSTLLCQDSSHSPHQHAGAAPTHDMYTTYTT